VRYSPVGVLLLAAIPATSQFHQLATDATGSRVWFTTDLVARGSGRQPYARIWTADAEGRVVLAAERTLSDRHSLFTRPQVSDDGAVVVWDAQDNCPLGATCRNPDPLNGVVTAAGQVETEIGGRIHLSRTGRWILRESYSFFAPHDQIEIIDRQAGTRRQIPVTRSAYLEGGPRVSAGGSVLVYSNSLWLIRPDGSYVSVTSNGMDPDLESSRWFNVRRPGVTMDDAASLVAYETTSGPREIYAVRPGDETSHRVIASDAWAPVLSGDASRLLFLSSVNGVPQAFTMPANGGERRQITRDPAGIAEATLSGNGNVVWAATLAGGIIRADIASGKVQGIVPQTTVVESNVLGFPFRVAAGAIGRVAGRGLASGYASSGFPLVTELLGVRLESDGQPLPLVSVSPYEIRFQAPWDLTGRHTLTLPATNSPFEEQRSRTVDVVAAAPEFLITEAGLPAIVHGDFRGLVTPDAPARPGEILHLYLTGLGPVIPPVRTGEANPASPLSYVAERTFAFWQGSLPSNMPQPEILFAGLAPGMIGVYQVDVRVPLIAPSALGISVQVGNSGASAEFPVSLL
jgi:uncharacterized protein (TIGR03437 family)